MQYAWIYATVPELARHEVGVVVHRAKRVQRFECPTMNDVNDLRWMLSMMDWSTINIRAARTSGQRAFYVLRTTFSASNFGFKIGCFSKAQNPAKPPDKTCLIMAKKNHQISRIARLKSNFDKSSSHPIINPNYLQSWHPQEGRHFLSGPPNWRGT